MTDAPGARRGERGSKIIRAFLAVSGCVERSIALDRASAASYFEGPGKPLGSPVERRKIMNWETPSFVEIDMSAEIGSYQGEDDNGL